MYSGRKAALGFGLAALVLLVGCDEDDGDNDCPADDIPLGLALYLHRSPLNVPALSKYLGLGLNYAPAAPGSGGRAGRRCARRRA